MIVNGTPYALTAMSAKALIDYLEIDLQKIVMEVNGVIVAREAFETFIIPEGAVVEVVSFVGGG